MFKIEIKSLETLLEDYKNDLVSAFKGHGLMTIAIYGPGHMKNAGDRVETWLVFKKLDVSNLSALRDIWKKYAHYNFSTPFVTQHYEITGMDDSFPLEAIEGLYGYKVLWGEDIFKGIHLKPKEHRAQIEFELRSRLIHLRKVWMESEALDPVQTMTMLFRIYEDILFCSRISIILKDRKTKYDTKQLFEKIGEAYKMPKKVMKGVEDLMTTLEEQATVPQKKADKLYECAQEYLSFLLKKVDEMEKDICK